MSVYVKGMEIPETCIQCPMQFGGWCYVSPPGIDERVAPTVDEAVEQGKPEWCPLVEVPTLHGRLIDADKVVKSSDNLPEGTDITIVLEKVKTIIEAEE